MSYLVNPSRCSPSSQGRLWPTVSHSEASVLTLHLGVSEICSMCIRCTEGFVVKYLVAWDACFPLQSAWPVWLRCFWLSSLLTLLEHRGQGLLVFLVPHGSPRVPGCWLQLAAPRHSGHVGGTGQSKAFFSLCSLCLSLALRSQCFSVTSIHTHRNRFS